LASLLLDEIKSEQRWTQTLSGSQDLLKSLAADALAEHRVGKTRPLDDLL
jgi:hypothetical protein